ncbi:carotenoid biosynthesis protein [Gracilibacillus marinus]|jgi:uncharacterized membrane protein|uniref:Carotenoid biosynthesis protein n=1 Tax=Gracilibacillus marinus TaxID=630535 RepID=A0ABV8VWR9_9BACI
MPKRNIVYPLFLVWYGIGFTLMFFFTLPDYLLFSVAIFLILFAWASISLYAKGNFDWLIACLICIVTFAIEAIGVATGFPFGEYTYTSILGAKLFGVPFTLGFAWLGVIYTAILLSNTKSKVYRAIEVGCWIVILDLVLDPAAVVLNFWEWTGDGDYFSIPLSNFIAWFVIGSFLSLFVPIRNISLRERRKGTCIFQAILFMFGMLTVKEGYLFMLVPMIAGMTLAEGRYHYAKSKEK